MSKVFRQPQSLIKLPLEKSVKRIIDANLNRALEGMRVCEEYCRFVSENRNATSEIKKLRHSLANLVNRLGVTGADLVSCRNSNDDIGKKSIPSEKLRSGLKQVVLCNLQRVKEALRVLEEYLKIYFDTEGFKKIRYRFYEIEKRIIKQL